MSKLKEIPFLDSKIDDVIERFDFIKVHRAMNFLNWKWMHADEAGLRVPAKERIIEMARYLLYQAAGHDSGVCQSGGFRATRNSDNTFTLEFILTHYTNPLLDFDRSNPSGSTNAPAPTDLSDLIEQDK